MPKQGIIGIDIGGTKLLFTLFNSSFEPIDDIKAGTPRKERAEFQEVFLGSVKKLMTRAAAEDLEVATVGIGCSGSIDNKAGSVRCSPNIPALDNFSFNKALSKFEVGIHAQNDVDAALYGELELGAAVGYRHVIAVFIGTGIGGAIAIDGKVYTGANGHAGDLGNYLLQPMSPLAGSERHGILDDFASRIAIAGDAATLAAREKAPYLLSSVGTDIQNIKSQSLAKAIRAGDKAIEELLRSRSHIIGIVLSNLVDFLNPELVLVGGGLTDAMPELVRSEIEGGIKAHTTANAKQGLRIVTTALKGRAVATGAAKFAWDCERARKNPRAA